MELDLGSGRDESVTVALGEPVELRLDVPGGTGFMWHLSGEQPNCRVVDRQLTADSESIGGPGQVRFTLEPQEVGEAECRVLLQAPWEQEPAREHTLRIEVVDRDQ